MIVVDYSSVAIAAITVFMKDLDATNEDEVSNLIKHVIISTIKMYKKRFSAEFGNEIIIACDSRHYWRKDIFPHYKCKRKEGREKSDIPWDLIHKYMDEVKHALINYFPYKVIEVYGAEADDILAIMAMHVGPQLITSNGLFEDQEKVLLITTDKDASQLLTNEYTRQWNPREQKFVKLEMNAKKFLRKLILTGDSGDSIPNVFSPSDSFFTKTRQKPATEKKMQPFMDAKFVSDVETTPEISKRISENSQLISFAFIPEYVINNVIFEYNKPITNDRMTIYHWLTQNKMTLMLKDIEQF